MQQTNVLARNQRSAASSACVAPRVSRVGHYQLRKANLTCSALATASAPAPTAHGPAHTLKYSKVEDLMRQVDAANTASSTGVLQQHSRPAVAVLFSAPWCGPCQLMAAELQKLKEHRQGEVEIMMINSDENKELVQRMGITLLPTTVFMGRAASSRPVISAVGVVQVRIMEDLLDNKMHLAGADLYRAMRLY